MKKKLIFSKICPILMFLSGIGILGLSCSDEDGGDIKQEIPFKSVFVEADNEKIEATIVDEKNLSLLFEKAEDFEHSKVEIELNEGFTLIFPEDITNADFLNYPVLNFRNKHNNIIKYWLKIASKAFPVLDASKIEVVGVSNSEITYENKQIVISFNKTQMDMQNITLEFGEGSLLDEAVIKSDLNYDFTKGLIQYLTLDIAGKEQKVAIRLDQSKVVKNPRDYGFVDISNKYVGETEYPFIKVYKANSIPGIPIVNKKDGWEVETPWSWDSPAYMLDWPGDWTEDREKETIIIEGEGFFIATIDIDKAKTHIISNDKGELTLKDINGLIAMTGMGTIERTMVFWNNKVIKSRMMDEDGVAWRGAIGTNSEGELSIYNATVNQGKMYKLPFFNDFTGNYLEQAEVWDINAAACGRTWALRNGRLLTRQEIYQNDGSGWEIAFGEAWNGQWRSRSFIGITYDNKIAVAVLPSWGLSVPQCIWIFEKLGWKDAFYTGGNFWEHGEFTPTLRVNGKVVGGMADQSQQAQYCITIDVKK